jgi:hypothetical protein
MGFGWSRYPNISDLRAVLSVEDREQLWLAALSGLVKVDLAGEAWTVMTEFDGLADNVTVSLARQNNWLWVGTQGGISRYDLEDQSWRTFTSADGLSSDYNVVVYFDGETIWAGTREGLSWYVPETDRWESLYTAAGIEISGVAALLNDGRFLWIFVEPNAETPGGLLRANQETGEWEIVTGPADAPVANAMQLTQSDLFVWAVPYDGLPWEYNKAAGIWRVINELDGDIPEPGTGFLSPQFYADALWMYRSDSSELVRYEPATRQVSRYPAAPLAQASLQGQISGRDNRLFFPTREGLIAFDLETGEWQTLRQGVGEVRQILGARGGALLIDSDLGPGFWNPDDDYWRPLAPVGGSGQISPSSAALEQGAKSVWLLDLRFRELGSEEPPYLLYFTEPGVEPQRFELMPPTDWQVFQLLPQPVGNTVWFIGNRGFLSYNPAIDQWGVYEIAAEPYTGARAFHQAANTVWFVTETELGEFDIATGSHTLTPLPVTTSTQAALAATSDEIWLLADDILFHRELDSPDWIQTDAAAPCLDEADQMAWWGESLWVGGVHGVGRLDPDGEIWVCYTPASGMLDQAFQQLVPTQEGLWFGHIWYGVWRYRER